MTRTKPPKMQRQTKPKNRNNAPGNNNRRRGRPKMGRPTKFNPEVHNKLVLILMEEGRSRTEVARDMGIAYTTLLDWERAHPTFAKALKEGHYLAKAWWETQGRENVTIPHGQKFTTGLYSLMMVNRFGYKSAMTDARQKIQQDVTTTHRMQFDMEDLTTDELTVLHKVLGQYLASRDPARSGQPGGGARTAQESGDTPTTVH